MCFDQIKQPDDGIAIHPVTGKCVHVIGALTTDGTQRQLSDEEISIADSLELDRRIVQEDLPNVTTFAQIADLSLAALQAIPRFTVDLKGFLDYNHRNRHHWSTEEGLGQSLSYIQQAYFTLELCLKALLETTGRLILIPPNKWKEHEPTKLYKRLDRKTRKFLEGRWSGVTGTNGSTTATFEAFLASIDNMYTAWRYLPERKDFNLSAELSPILAACETVIDTSKTIFKRDFPIKIRGSVQIIASAEVQEQSHQRVPTFVTGKVTSVSVPHGFDPHSMVEIAIESGDSGFLTLETYKRNPEEYFDLESRTLAVAGFYTPIRPSAIEIANIVEIDGKQERDTSYCVEVRTLQGTIYDVTKPKGTGRLDTTILALEDETFFTMVQCLFLTKKEQEQITGTVESGQHFQFGDRISIRGLVTLRNGLPVVLVGPNSISKLTPEQSP